MASPTQQDEDTWQTSTVVGLIVGLLGLLIDLGMAFILFDALTTAVGGLSILAAILGAIFAQAKYPQVSARHAPAIVRILLVVVIVATVAMIVYGYHRAHRPIDVTARVVLGSNRAVLPGQSATLDVHVTESRPRLDIVFRVSDNNSETSNCASLTELSITPVQGGNSGEPITAEPGAPVRVPVLAHAQDVHLDVEVRNAHQDNGCAVDIAVTSAPADQRMTREMA